jgi:SAM-dependent methyltransferase
MKLLYFHGDAIDNILKRISSDYKEYKNFLDLGCGKGQRTVFFIRPGRNVTGIDLYDEGTPQLKKFKFVKKNIFKNGFPDKSFDMVFNFDVIEHLEKPGELMKECNRLLKKGGICIVSTPNRYRLTNVPLLLIGLRKYPYCIDERFRDEYPNYWHITEFTGRQLYNLANQYGFNVEKHYKIHYGLAGRTGIKSLKGFPFFHNHILVLKKR